MRKLSEIEKELLTYPVVSAYEVISNYPNSPWTIGEIIEFRQGPDPRFATAGIIEPYAYTHDGAKMEYEFKRYPKFFKKIK